MTDLLKINTILVVVEIKPLFYVILKLLMFYGTRIDRDHLQLLNSPIEKHVGSTKFNCCSY